MNWSRYGAIHVVRDKGGAATSAPAEVGMARNGSMGVAFRIGSAQPDIPAILLGLRLFE